LLSFVICFTAQRRTPKIHKRMITLNGTPSSQSRNPFPMILLSRFE